MIKVEDYAEGTPERKMAEFFKAWKEADWEAMVKATQISWIEAMPKAKEMLKAMFQFKLINAEVAESRMLNNVAFAAMVKIDYQIARGVVKTMESDVRVICEKEPMLPAPDGEWGVNPNSAQVV
ncbi:unnamed protein product [marine sediment metagenome]|uniref:Uncharacterized protein n=1 Tax=marine sediment metagenome TaxID=412755 RepID=X1JZJ9_9ZZZZ